MTHIPLTYEVYSRVLGTAEEERSYLTQIELPSATPTAPLDIAVTVPLELTKEDHETDFSYYWSIRSPTY